MESLSQISLDERVDSVPEEKVRQLIEMKEFTTPELFSPSTFLDSQKHGSRCSSCGGGGGSCGKCHSVTWEEDGR
jgi:Na+-transporting NADH:ubiquinone oxidoreductase subunit NqrF